MSSRWSRERTALEAIYRFEQRLCYCLLEKGMNQKRCHKLARRFLADVGALRCCGFTPLVRLRNVLHSWCEEIACMWRFTRNNGITEGFHTQIGGPPAPGLRLPQLPELSVAR